MTDSNGTAQDLATAALQQYSVLSKGFLTQQTADPDPTINRKPWIDEPEGSIPFDPQAGVLLPAVGAGAVMITLVVPTGYDGVIKFLSHNAVFPFNDFSGDIQWQLFIDGRAVRNFDNMLAQKGTIGIPRPISPLRVYSGQILTYVVNHLANVALNGNVVASLNGYFYPSQGNS